MVASPGEVLQIEARRLAGKSGYQPQPLLERDPPANARIEYVQFLDLATRDGWKMQLVTYQFLADDGRVLELRLGAVYEMHYYAGVAIARTRDAAAYHSLRAEVLAVLTSARPHLFGPEPVTIEELWSLESP